MVVGVVHCVRIGGGIGAVMAFCELGFRVYAILGITAPWCCVGDHDGRPMLVNSWRTEVVGDVNALRTVAVNSINKL